MRETQDKWAILIHSSYHLSRPRLSSRDYSEANYTPSEIVNALCIIGREPGLLCPNISTSFKDVQIRWTTLSLPLSLIILDVYQLLYLLTSDWNAPAKLVFLADVLCPSTLFLSKTYGAVLIVTVLANYHCVTRDRNTRPSCFYFETSLACFVQTGCHHHHANPRLKCHQRLDANYQNHQQGAWLVVSKHLHLFGSSQAVGTNTTRRRRSKFLSRISPTTLHHEQ